VLKSPYINAFRVNSNTLLFFGKIWVLYLFFLFKNGGLIEGYSLNIFDRFRKNTSLAQSSPGFSEVSTSSTKSRHLPQQLQPYSPQQQSPQQVDLTEEGEESTLNADMDLTTAPVRSDSYVVRFPATIVNHKTCAKITFKNFSTEQHHVSESPFLLKR